MDTKLVHQQQLVDLEEWQTEDTSDGVDVLLYFQRIKAKLNVK